ncbi:MAG: DUF1934 domain-containing protein [Oscillospiraceae bacterium]|nr:DUF1934 domain-containing protein [Oscillospiraceae bacterium]
MRKNVTITVKSAEAHYRVRGVMEYGEAETRLVYEEPAALGLGGVTTELALCGGRAVLKRSGEVRSELRFEVGAPHASVYETKHGSFPAELVTHAVRARLSPRGGPVELHYTLTLGGAADEHRLRLWIRTEE